MPESAHILFFLYRNYFTDKKKNKSPISVVLPLQPVFSCFSIITLMLLHYDLKALFMLLNYA